MNMNENRGDVTLLLDAFSGGDGTAEERLFSIIYDKLHVLAHMAMRKEAPGQVLQTTALVNEAYIKLVQNKEFRWNNRSHFFALAARAMRRILIGEARKRKAAKRGSGKPPWSLEEAGDLLQDDSGRGDTLEYLVRLDKALDKLRSVEQHKRKCTIVECRFFVGLTLDQTAEALGISRATVSREWEYAKVLLFRELKGASGDGD
jgi:RNA polymerase sigma factor (TIGR02999 family)